MSEPTITEQTLLVQVERAHLPQPVREHRFHPTRLWRFDFAWPDSMLALEIEGGIWTGGRHTTGAGYRADMDKYNEAALLGWRVLRTTPKRVKEGEALELVRKGLA